jgi:hypothetical protein
MKKFTFNFVFAIFPTLLTAQNMKGMDHAKRDAISLYLRDPEIHASKPGKCPKCGMDLVKEKQNLLKSHCAKQAQKQC